MMQIELVTNRFVHYDDDGKITKIGHVRDETMSAIEVPFEEVKPLMTGKESLASFIVEWDFLEKKNVLKHVSVWQNDQLKESFLYEIKTDKDADAVIQQDKKNKCWRLILSDDVLQANVDPTKQFYSVTKKYDPNILYRLFRFTKVDNEYVVPFEYDFEVDNLDLSIYTVRKFSTYCYEVLE
tara:strand:- start:539 stop:1084 length:546 start_codon:yes stop_codon:yes gene_type:complete